MTKSFDITTGRNKTERINQVEKHLGRSSSHQENSGIYRFTAVLPESMGKRLRLHCARHNLRMKNVFADAVGEFLDRHEKDAPPQELH